MSLNFLIIYNFSFLSYGIKKVGKPVECKKNPFPSEAELNECHSRYVKELQELYDRYKEVYDRDRKKDMTFVE
jgi:hypothetical protein